MPDTLPRASRLALFLIYTIAFLNIASGTIVMPVLPFLAQRYAHDPAAVALWVGVLASAYSLCALIAAPALGALSDRVGRRPVLLISLVGSAVGFVVFGIGGAMWVLLLGRVIDGLTGGNSSTIMAYLADVTPPEDRAKRFGFTGAIMGVGFLLGPAIGGVLASFGLSAPVFVAAAICLVTAGLSLFALPESLSAEKRTESFSLADVHPFRSISDALRRPHLRPLLLGMLFVSVPMAGLQTNLGVVAKDAISWGPTQIGLLLLGVGIVDIVVQGGLLRLALPRIGERGVIVAGLVGQGIGYAIIGLVASALALPWLFVVGALIFAGSEGGSGPAMAGLLSAAVSHREQGWVMGGLQSMNSAARVIGPLLAGLLYSAVSHSAPYWCGVAVMLGLFVFWLPELLRGHPEPAEEPAPSA